MPSGFGVNTEAWLKEFEECKELAQEVVQLLQERNTQFPNGGPEASRKTASARKKIGTLGTTIERLLRMLDTPESAGLSEAEKNRRRDLLFELRNRREQLAYSIKRTPGSSDREALLNGSGGTSSSSRGPGQETEATAELDNQQLLGLQSQIIKAQDHELEDMEKAISHTKHIALTINEEVDLQTRLLEDLEEDVDVTHSRLKAATLRVKQVMRQSSTWKYGCVIFLLIVGLVLTLIFVLKLWHLFGGR